MRGRPRVHGGVDDAALRRPGHGKEKWGRIISMRSNFTMISPYVSITMIFKLWPVFVILSILIYGMRRATTNYYYGKLSQ